MKGLHIRKRLLCENGQSSHFYLFKYCFVQHCRREHQLSSDFPFGVYFWSLCIFLQLLNWKTLANFYEIRTQNKETVSKERASEEKKGRSRRRVFAYICLVVGVWSCSCLSVLVNICLCMRLFDSWFVVLMCTSVYSACMWVFALFEGAFLSICLCWCVRKCACFWVCLLVCLFVHISVHVQVCAYICA